MKALFFDFGDVLVFYDHMRGCRALAGHTSKTPEEIYELIFGSKLEELHYNRGEYTDREWYDMCVDKLALRDCPYDVFAEKWGAIFDPNDSIEQALSSLKPDVELFVISNTNGLHWAWAQKNLTILSQYFPRQEQRILSCEEKSRKPELRIYENALKRAGVQTRDALLVDDKIENIQIFREMGGNGIVYNAHSSRVSDLINELKTYGYI